MKPAAEGKYVYRSGYVIEMPWPMFGVIYVVSHKSRFCFTMLAVNIVSDLRYNATNHV